MTRVSSFPLVRAFLLDICGFVVTNGRGCPKSLLLQLTKKRVAGKKNIKEDNITRWLLNYRKQFMNNSVSQWFSRWTFFRFFFVIQEKIETKSTYTAYFCTLSSLGTEIFSGIYPTNFTAALHYNTIALSQSYSNRTIR